MNNEAQSRKLTALLMKARGENPFANDVGNYNFTAIDYEKYEEKLINFGNSIFVPYINSDDYPKITKFAKDNNYKVGKKFKVFSSSYCWFKTIEVNEEEETEYKEMIYSSYYDDKYMNHCLDNAIGSYKGNRDPKLVKHFLSFTNDSNVLSEEDLELARYLNHCFLNRGQFNCDDWAISAVQLIPLAPID